MSQTCSDIHLLDISFFLPSVALLRIESARSFIYQLAEMSMARSSESKSYIVEVFVVVSIIKSAKQESGKSCSREGKEE